MLVTGLALKTSDSFCSYSLGTQLPCYKEAQALLLERRAMWRGPGRLGATWRRTEAPDVWERPS